MIYLWNFILVFAIVGVTPKHDYSDDPFCFGRLVGEDLDQRHFVFAKTCDLTPLAKPYNSFPPSVLIIGAQKGGTSALTFLLQGYTELETGRWKEIRFLSFRPDVFKTVHPGRASWLQYEALLLNASGPSIDGSPGYYTYGGYIFENLLYTIRVGLPKIPKMVFILRNPLARLYSHYNMRKVQSHNPDHRLYKTKIPSLESYIDNDLKKLRDCGMDINLNDPDFDPRTFYDEDLMWCYHKITYPLTDMHLVKGMYSWQLEMMRRSANPNRVIIACYDDFVADNRGFVNMIAEFIGVGLVDVKENPNWSLMPSKEKQPECPSAYRKAKKLPVDLKYERILNIFYSKWNKVLAEDFGIDCGWTRDLRCH